VYQANILYLMTTKSEDKTDLINPVEESHTHIHTPYTHMCTHIYTYIITLMSMHIHVWTQFLFK